VPPRREVKTWPQPKGHPACVEQSHFLTLYVQIALSPVQIRVLGGAVDRSQATAAFGNAKFKNCGFFLAIMRTAWKH